MHDMDGMKDNSMEEGGMQMDGAGILASQYFFLN